MLECFTVSNVHGKVVFVVAIVVVVSWSLRIVCYFIVLLNLSFFFF